MAHTPEDIERMAALLDKQAYDMSVAGHNGWPNSMRFAAEMLRSLAAERDAAPDLLAVVKAMLEEFDDHDVPDNIKLNIGGWSANSVKALESARAAIAKAEGAQE